MDNNLLKIEELYVNAEDKEILKGIIDLLYSHTETKDVQMLS